MPTSPARVWASSLIGNLSSFSSKCTSSFVCRPCRRELSRLAVGSGSHAPKSFITGSRRLATATATATGSSGASTRSINNEQEGLQRNYFLWNEFWGRESKRVGSMRIRSTSSGEAKPFEQSSSISSSGHNLAPRDTSALLPHRKRRRKMLEAQTGEEQQQQQQQQQQQEGETMSRAGAHELPLDASSHLSSLSQAQPKNSFRQRFFAYLSLSKPRLGFLIVLTTTTAYSLFPVAVTPLSSALSLSPLTLLNLTTGTALSIASANALNMLLEPAYDAQMTRTRTRPIVRGLISKRAALIFAIATGAAGVGLLYTGVNPTVAALSALNIGLYAGVYTPLKRISVINTWAGAVVGGIPPLMGWAAAAGAANPDATWRELLFDPTSSPGGWLLAALLFAWQFPHFNALSYPIRHEYAAAGYKMLASVNVRKTALIALRYSLAMFPICVGLSAVGVTSWAFVATSGLVNTWMSRDAWRFYRHEGAHGSARALFWASVWHLPLVLVLAMLHKKGLWDRFVNGGIPADQLHEYYEPIDHPIPVEDLDSTESAEYAVRKPKY